MRVKKASTKEKSFKLLSLLLSLCMIVGLLPTAIFAADADTDYLMFATDRHANTSIIGNIINNIESDIGENELDYLGLGGDMVGSGDNHPAYNSSTVLDEATGATSSLSETNVDIVAGIHDMNVTDDAGIVLPYQGGGAKIYEGDKFYVYGVEEYCISEDSNESNWSSEAQKFVTWANGSDVDKSKVIIMLSHYPLHAKRNDNDGAYYWHQAINTVATGSASGDSTVERNIVFFHGHNHTKDSNEYVYNVGDTMSIQNGSSTTDDKIYYTYATAGYLNQNSKATLMAITDDTITLTKYTTSGSGTVMTNVERVEPAVTLSSIAISGDTEYQVGNELALTVTATYSDGTSADVTADATLSGYDMASAGTYTVAAKYEGMTASIVITVTAPAATVNTVSCWDDTDQVFVEATGLGLTAVEATNVTGENEKCDEIFTANGYMAFDIALTGHAEGESVEYSISVVPDLDITNLELYYVEETGELTPVEFELTTDELNNVYVEFTTDKEGTFVYGSPAVPEGYALTSLTLANIPNDVFLGTSLVLDETAEITATYTKNGAEDFVRKLTIYDYDYTDFSGFDVNVPGKQTVTFTFEGVSATHDIYVWGEEFTDETTGVTVHVGEDEYGVTEAVVAESINANVATAIQYVITGDNYVAYDITLTYSEGYEANDAAKTVTLPIPGGVTNPVVYYVSDSGKSVVDMKAVNNGDGTVTFTTTHFSTYVLGDGTVIEIGSQDATVESTTTTTTKTVYVLTSSISSGNDYLIVNGNSAGSYYALANNSGSVAATGVTVKTDSEIGTYIELDDAADELWLTASGYTFQNGSYYLGYTTSGNSLNQNYSFDLSTTARDWSYSTNNNRLSTSVGSWNSTTYYLRYNNGWTWTSQNNASGRSVYFYAPQEITVTTGEPGHTYSVEGTDMEVAAIKDATIDLSSVLYDTPTGTNVKTDITASSGLTPKYEIVTTKGNPNVITSITDGVATLSGTTGTAVVKVTYTSGDLVAWDEFIITATTPDHYGIQLHEKRGDTYGEEITEPVALKGVEAGDTYSIWAVVKAYASADDTEGTDIGTLGNALTWTVSDTSIATINEDTGVITFTGDNFGTFTVTVAYEGADGKVVTDTITISATDTTYIVPGDGTDDFPEYPNEGAIRFDKTAEAVGNFSQTGIAKVELSMTGVPYTTGSEIDVVLMLDMTGSMDDVTSSTSEPTGYVRIDATIAASKTFIETIVKNEDGTYNGNRIGVYVFNKNGAATLYDFGTVDSDTELEAINADLNTIKDDHFASGGTPYDDGLSKCQEVLAAAKTDGVGNDRQQFTVFMTDGVPTSYAYVNGDSYGTHSSASAVAGMLTSSDNYATRDSDYKYEYYSTEMKKAGVTVYSVGVGLENENNAWSGSATQCLNLASALLNDISGPANEASQPDAAGTSTLSKKDSYFFSVADADAGTEMEKIFKNIAQEILDAATDVVVEDKVGKNYSLNFSLPSGVTSSEAGMSEFYIQVVDYTLDATTHERTNTYTVLENFTFNADGTLKSHTVDGTACSNCSHVTVTNGTITKIEGTYFSYENKADGEYLTWTAEKLTSTELVLQYFAYLDNSAGVDAKDAVAAGTYYTNEYATLTYTNHLGNRCQQEFPIPQMTWKGAQVTYVFYLVNEAGQPVNKAGRVIPFAEAVYVTTPVTHSVTWNEETGTEKILAENLFASAGVPDVYALYDEDAQYVIRVYQTEDVDTNGVNGNYFQINGANDKLIDSEMDTDTTVDNSTTKVYNTKAGAKYDKYGIYSEYVAGTTLTDGTNNIQTTVKTDDIDYADTTVAFAVVWKPELAPDTVVIDYGLDVVIDVIKNDNMAAGVTGVMLKAPNAETDGTYETAVGENSVTSADGVWTASVENLTSVRFHLNNMKIAAPVTFYYEAGVNYYKTGETTVTTTNMYSSVTVIPATTVYYEDNFIDLTSYTVNKDAEGNSTSTKDTNSAWVTDGTSINKTQAQDRPGESKISAALDADNNYGYDAAYETMTTYSLGSTAMIDVNASKRGEATFTFYGTGFDIIGLTSNTTGTLIVQVYDSANNVVKSSVIDTYYGYAYVNGEWVAVDTNNPNALYQVPVMKIFGLDYGKYTVKLTAGYNSYFDHTNDSLAEGETDDASYTLYLDGVRIYDPCGTGSSTNEDAQDAYEADGEGWPEYTELRDKIIKAETFQSLQSNEVVSGIVFIDGATTDPDGTVSIADYTSYGPNNELYLAYGQAVAADLNAAKTGYEVRIQLGIKTVGGTGNVQVYSVNSSGNVVEMAVNQEISTATDMYYDITALNGQTLVIKNAGTSSSDAIISITNIKVTYSPTAQAASEVNAVAAASLDEEVVEEIAVEEVALLSVRADTASYAVMSLSAEDDSEVEETPEENIPEAENPKPGKPEKPSKDKPAKPEKPDNPNNPNKGPQNNSGNDKNDRNDKNNGKYNNWFGRWFG